MVFWNTEVSPQTLQRFLSKCPMLENIHLWQGPENAFIAGENKNTFVDLLQCVPLIKTLDVLKDYMKYLSASGMTHTLPTSLVHLKVLDLSVCLMDRNEISATLCIIQSSPMLENIVLSMDGRADFPVQQTPNNFLHPQNHPDLNLNHLEILEISMIYSMSPPVMEFVKLIMGKSPVLKKVQIRFDYSVSVDFDVELEMLLLSFPRASPSAKLIIECPQGYEPFYY
ncbi:F-box/FBD/LRR-repeat protein At1g13570-like [Bidens hawaiensis]|uniref:F-box/FBD/LRR-repeat protein At1g13570-like n=1 Tax=Bidens hawaiensis TaxID=980011 RepID=UPI00404B2D77